MDWGNWVWRSKCFSATEPDSTREKSQNWPEGFGLLIVAICRSNMEIYFDILVEWMSLTKKNDGREEWISQVGETHTLYLLLMKHWSINSGYPLAKERIQWKSSFPQSYMCVFFQSNLFNRQIPESVNCFLICECVSQIRFTSLKINGWEPENHLFEKQDHLPSLPGPKKIGWFCSDKNGRPTFGRISGTSRAAATRCTAFTWMSGRCGPLDQLHPWMPGDRWHRKLGFMMQWLEMIQFDVRIFFKWLGEKPPTSN